jgi:serpin B
MRLSVLLLPALFLAWGVAAAVPAKVDTRDVVKGNNQFAFELYHRLSGKQGNVFLSPYSISTALAMTSAGARGKTAEQIQEVFHFPAQGELHPGVAALRHEINSASGKRKYQLSTANALWGAKGYPFRPEFLNLAKDEYGAELTNLDFAADPEGARQTINGWVEKETQDKIKDLIGRDVLAPDTRLVLTNAIYFKGMWELPFKKGATKDQPFRTAGGARPKVPLMSQTAHFGYAETDDYQALQMPYAGDRLALLVLLPKKDDLAGLEKELSASFVAGVVGKMGHERVEVHVPRFKTTAEFELSATLKAMGMPLAFSDGADFSGMTVSRQESLMLSKVIHKAFVDVNEEGTEAAAATAVIARPTAAAVSPKPVPVFRADHPFVYLIRDTRNGSVLFLGRLADPMK